VPFHLRLALSDAKSTSPDRHAHNRCRFVAAALLKAVGKAKLIDIEACVEGFYRNYEVHVLKIARKLAA
jgi:hypothetical protein